MRPLAAIPLRQMVEQTLLEKRCASEIVTVLGQPDNGQFDFNPSAAVEQMGEHDAADLLWQPVGNQPVEESLSTQLERS